MARILLVDDCDIVRRALEVTLRRMGHDVVSADAPLVALDLATFTAPDLALLDFHMPNMTGIDLLRTMRDRLGSRCPTALFVSAAPPEDVADLSDLVVGSVHKPFHVHEIQAAVEKALRTGRNQAPPLKAA
jgi:CheY-like chemotaxis protein